MKVAIHQPEHMPWAGFFHKMNAVDTFILLDTVPFSKNNWQNRNRFLSSTGKPFWLTVPVHTKGHTLKPFSDIEIDNSKDWRKKYWLTLELNYQKTPYFKFYSPEIKSILFNPFLYLFDLNLTLLLFFRRVLKINNTLLLASKLKIPEATKTSRLIEICKEVGASTYLSGMGGTAYLEEDLFQKHGIQLEFDHFQEKEGLYPNLSILDRLFRLGPKTKNFIAI